jgi:hypothetical protein
MQEKGKADIALILKLLKTRPIVNFRPCGARTSARQSRQERRRRGRYREFLTSEAMLLQVVKFPNIAMSRQAAILYRVAMECAMFLIRKPAGPIRLVWYGDCSRTDLFWPLNQAASNSCN